MIKTGLPASLVKCLYLFVALPPRKESFVSRNDVEEEVKCSFQDTLTQVFTFGHVFYYIMNLLHHKCSTCVSKWDKVSPLALPVSEANLTKNYLVLTVYDHLYNVCMHI